MSLVQHEKSPVTDKNTGFSSVAYEPEATSLVWAFSVPDFSTGFATKILEIAGNGRTSTILSI